jgi:hypothetical protein
VGQLSQIYLYDIYFNHSGAISLAKSCAMSDMPRQHTCVGTLFIMFWYVLILSDTYWCHMLVKEEQLSWDLSQGTMFVTISG